MGIIREFSHWGEDKIFANLIERLVLMTLQLMYLIGNGGGSGPLVRIFQANSWTRAF